MTTVASGEERKELKEKMRKAQFTLGPRVFEQQIQTTYTSGIDATAKLGGLPSDGEPIRKEMKKTSFSIGEGVLSSETEAAS